MKPHVRILSSKRLYNGRIIRLKLDRVVEPGGVEVTREIVEHHGSVVVIPRLPNGKIVMVRQFRYATQMHLWELVAGSMDPGESITRAARRELQEETGYHARSLKRLFSFYPSPGFLTEQMHLVEARDLSLVEASPEEDERIEVAEFSKIQLDTLLREHKIADGKTLVGLLWDRWRGRVAKANRNR
ncbi:MAG TPA: NUDIX hydrolase [Terriglobia bacterium]|nr:NUDIX hydrolase [Terriglobia bacterium]